MKVTILGLGIIGATWASNLRTDGVGLRLWNRTSREAPDFYGSAQEAVRGSEVIFIVVSDSAAVHGILDVIVPVLQSGQTVLQCSTITPSSVRQAAEKVHTSGADFLDLPFTGSKPAAQKRETVYYAGGKAIVLEKVRPILARLSKAIIHIGDIGTASMIKLAMNLNVAQVGQALSESLQLARAGGITDEIFFKVLQLNVSKSGLADLKEPKLRSGDFSPQFSIKHMLKDLYQAREVAGELPLPQLERTIEIYENGLKQGWGEEDFIALIKLLKPEKTGGLFPS